MRAFYTQLNYYFFCCAVPFYQQNEITQLMCIQFTPFVFTNFYNFQPKCELFNLEPLPSYNYLLPLAGWWWDRINHMKRYPEAFESKVRRVSSKLCWLMHLLTCWLTGDQTKPFSSQLSLSFSTSVWVVFSFIIRLRQKHRFRWFGTVAFGVRVVIWLSC